MDTTIKFDGRARDYIVGRPSYAEELIKCLYCDYGISNSSVIADIGSGTGKFAKHLLERGSEVYCVEPNDDMRSVAESELSGYKIFILFWEMLRIQCLKRVLLIMLQQRKRFIGLM